MVSIPLGAIKAKPKKKTRTCSAVSIPLGAIKTTMETN